MLRRYVKRSKNLHPAITWENEDLLALAVEYLVRADLRYDKKLTPNINYHRYVYVIYAVKTYMHGMGGKRNAKENSHKRINAHYQDDTYVSHPLTPDSQTPDNIVIQKEESERSDARFTQLLSCPTLTEKQRQYIIMRYQDNLKPSEIARQLGINRWAVQQTLNRACENIRVWLET